VSIATASLAAADRFAGELPPPPPGAADLPLPPQPSPSDLPSPPQTVQPAPMLPAPPSSVLVPRPEPAAVAKPMFQKDAVVGQGECLCGKPSCGCHKERRIRYVHTKVPSRRVCCTCDPPAQAVLSIKDPCCCVCPVQIPVCLPTCCTDPPQVKARCGLAGRGYVIYEWCCGFTIRVVFQVDGDIVVHYHKNRPASARRAPVPVEIRTGMPPTVLAF
jgi:hypothetical protein